MVFNTVFPHIKDVSAAQARFTYPSATKPSAPAPATLVRTPASTPVVVKKTVPRAGLSGPEPKNRHNVRFTWPTLLSREITSCPM